jgi:hypothetical protein
VNNREIRPFELYLFIAVVYWVCTYSMSRYARSLEKRLGLPETVLPSGVRLHGARRVIRAGRRSCGFTGAPWRSPR